MFLRSPGFVVAFAVALVAAFARPAHAASEAVALLVPTGFFICVAVVAAIAARAHQRYTAEQHQTLRAMIDKGLQIPPHLLGEQRTPNPRRDIRRGIFLICLGVGMATFLWAVDGPDTGALGLIPALVGVGYLIAARLDRPRPADEPSLT